MRFGAHRGARGLGAGACVERRGAGESGRREARKVEGVVGAWRGHSKANKRRKVVIMPVGVEKVRE